MGRGHYIEGRWIQDRGSEITSHDPATGHVVWMGPGATGHEVEEAVSAAKSALEDWSARSVEERIRFIQAFARSVKEDGDALAETISMETGKPLWESRQEVNAILGKVGLTIQAYWERRAPLQIDISGARGSVRYRPLGVMAVLGPFNMPGHLPNGHILPALLSGNTVVFKPSRFVPLVAEKYVGHWEAAGLPPGVLNLLQCTRSAGGHLVDHPDIDGLLFTGSYETGKRLHEAFGGKPEKILALEMGGNNPLVVSNVSDADAAVALTVLSAFITSGQRCTCARRLILEQGREGDHFLDRLKVALEGIRVGPYTARPEPFYGPVISPEAAGKLLDFQEDMIRRGGRVIVRMVKEGSTGSLLRPGLVDVTGMVDRSDAECFGPLLQVIRVDGFEEAIREAGRTAYGLAAGLLSDSRSKWERFSSRVGAGHMVWNRQTTGASSRLPFGGLGLSGNHRPSGYFAVDYCSDPVASIETETLQRPPKLPPGLERIG